MGSMMVFFRDIFTSQLIVVLEFLAIDFSFTVF